MTPPPGSSGPPGADPDAGREARRAADREVGHGAQRGADRRTDRPTDGAARKRSRVRLLQRYVLNPWTKLATWAGLAPGLVLVETTGRRSGKRRRNVVGMHVEGATGWVVAEQGRHAGYVRNLEAHPDVRVRRHLRWHAARAEVVPDDDPRARLERFRVPGHAATVTRFGTDLLTIRFDLDREP